MDRRQFISAGIASASSGFTSVKGEALPSAGGVDLEKFGIQINTVHSLLTEPVGESEEADRCGWEPEHPRLYALLDEIKLQFNPRALGPHGIGEGFEIYRSLTLEREVYQTLSLLAEALEGQPSIPVSEGMKKWYGEQFGDALTTESVKAFQDFFQKEFTQGFANFVSHAYPSELASQAISLQRRIQREQAIDHTELQKLRDEADQRVEDHNRAILAEKERIQSATPAETRKRDIFRDIPLHHSSDLINVADRLFGDRWCLKVKRDTPHFCIAVNDLSLAELRVVVGGIKSFEAFRAAKLYHLTNEKKRFRPVPPGTPVPASLYMAIPIMWRGQPSGNSSELESSLTSLEAVLKKVKSDPRVYAQSIRKFDELSSRRLASKRD